MIHRMYKSFERLLAYKSSMSRGKLIVFEGCDRCGKTTQCKKAVKTLIDEGIEAEMITFPDRSTAIGKVISDYLERKCELEDHAVHLLFAANRWELMPRMKKALNAGKTLIVDRYSFSGVAFSSAKPTLDFAWCREPERGLMKPDGVLYFTLSPEEAAKRGQFGDERYEETTFQKQVAYNYGVLKKKDWVIIDADRTIEEVYTEVLAAVKSIIAKDTDKPPAALWCEEQVNGTIGTGGASVAFSVEGNLSKPDISSGEPVAKKSKTEKVNGSMPTVECDSQMSGDK